ncbi:MAG: TolC family protein [bacterium]
MKAVIKIFFIFFIVTSLTPINAQELNLKGAIDMALTNNDKIKQYEEKLKQKEYDVKTSWGNFLPTISLEGSFTHLNKDMQIDLNSIRDGMIQLQAGTQVELANIYSLLNTQTQLTQQQRAGLYSQYSTRLDGLLPQFVETFKKQNYYQAAFVGVQPLFLGGKLLAAKDFASAEKTAAQIELQKTKNEIIAEVIVNYFNYLLVKDVVQTRQNVLVGMQNHQKDAQKLFDEGLIANYHLLRAKVAVSEAERNLSDDLNNLDLAMLAFKNSLGLDNETNVTLTDTLVFKNSSIELETSLNNADVNQPLLQIIAQKKIASTQKYNVERSNFLPQIAAFGKYELYPQYLSSLEPRWAVGVQLKFNIFNGFKDYTKLESAIHLENEVNFIEASAKKQVNLWVNKTYKDVENSKTKYQKLEAAYNLAVENLRMNEKRFNTGMGTSLEVIDAQLSLEKVKIDKLVSINQYYKSLTELNLATGNPLNVLDIWENREN